MLVQDELRRVDFALTQENSFTRLVADRLGRPVRAAVPVLNSLALSQRGALRVPMNQNAITRSVGRLRADLEALAAAGLLHIQRGSWAERRETVVMATAQFAEWLDAAAAVEPLTIPGRRDLGSVVLRDDAKKPLPITPNGRRLELLRALQQFNRANLRHTWTIEHPAYGFLGEAYPWRDVTVVSPGALVYDRFFKGDLGHGGRFYNYMQFALRARDRHCLRVNGEPLVELDFKSLQPRLAYEARGLPAPDDCYAVPDLERDFVKTATTIAMNSRTRAGAVLAIERKCEEKVAEGDLTHVPSRADIRAALDTIVTHHAPIAADFFRLTGLSYQFMDSCICARVMADMAAEGVPLFVVHDGYFVPAAHERALEDSMVAAYRAVVGPNAQPVITRRAA